MKNTILLFCLFLTIISCKAQNYPLDTDYETIPNNSHIKDTNIVLEKYTGTWKSTIGNKEVYLFITKQNDRNIKLLSNEFYRDVLLIKYKILVNGNDIENTTNFNNEKINIISFGLAIDGSILLGYGGGKCRIGDGTINLKYIDPDHIQWKYYPQSIRITNINCPNNPGNLKIHLPYEPADIIFVKQ
ncbi:hypothetical protein PGH12_10415 [Chryseobacterium wangxinyae]|uniref:DUF6705 family protein n=1 Tax=Chryseobacterium sp. CY350 TaxID=2997336 RepID=UPI00226ED8D9|nr:DUF6705 family protein [Chryseobacterium sp. CY350]MCY0978730.1 hypothetical protein [Chryseobacterium sp. CY350]WBZ93889.1 hypothetical protein PGH12_10415 [Chryseobacterium sp. CY350]